MSRRYLLSLWLSVATLAQVQAAETSAIETPAANVPAKPGTGRLFVLAVGINAYPAKEKLSFAVKDARDLTEALQAKGRKVYKSIETKLVIDKEADRQGILDGIAWLQREVKAEDTAIIFYSGHGTKIPNAGFFLVPARYKDAQPLQTMISGTELKREAGKIPGSVVVLLDACFAGAIFNESNPRAAALRPLALDIKQELMKKDPTSAVAILCAARAREESEENDTIHHGIFTKVLLQGLSGKADLNSDGVITVGEVESFLKQRLPKASKGHQHATSNLASLPPTTPLASER